MPVRGRVAAGRTTFTTPKGRSLAFTRLGGTGLVGAELDSRDGIFCERFGLGSDGAVLVRPDGHIAWRVEAGSVTDHVVALGDAVARATARRAGIAGGREVAMAA